MTTTAQKIIVDKAVKEIKANTCLIVLSTGETTSGEPYYAYLLMSPSSYERYEHAQNNGIPFDFEEFGEVIAHEVGTDTPPDDLVQELKETYNLADESLF